MLPSLQGPEPLSDRWGYCRHPRIPVVVHAFLQLFGRCACLWSVACPTHRNGLGSGHSLTMVLSTAFLYIHSFNKYWRLCHELNTTLWDIAGNKIGKTPLRAAYGHHQGRWPSWHVIRPSIACWAEVAKTENKRTEWRGQVAQRNFSGSRVQQILVSALPAHLSEPSCSHQQNGQKYAARHTFTRPASEDKWDNRPESLSHSTVVHISANVGEICFGFASLLVTVLPVTR